MNAQQFLDRLVLTLRKRRWVITNPRVLSKDGMVSVSFDFTCPCGRVINERLQWAVLAPGRHATAVDIHELAFETWLRTVEAELQNHVDEEFGREDRA